ncbi:hypothetical protein CRG98_033412 [Punica granatum]|uniref:Terpene synthase N-terminal domain-containing protein n=1 Tax=Punica granatum TaxID=22663 RepID=A0A2I0IQ70_PUNGR|nr:hypothetical protein CRG98_033412 [Punica granatum]
MTRCKHIVFSTLLQMNHDNVEQRFSEIEGGDIFNKFKDTSIGGFKESIITDMRGLLSLYEASHLRVQGEDVLEEALAFTRTHLERFVKETSNVHDDRNSNETSLASQESHALKQCLRKGLTRVEARQYISIYEEEVSLNEVLLSLAKLGFNSLQKQHQKELNDISSAVLPKVVEKAGHWKKAPFVRDRAIECYFWILGVYFEPQCLCARDIPTKVILLTSNMDDVYDVYGTTEEL